MPTTITPFTTSPSRANPATFSADMDTRLTQENSRITEMNLQSSENNVINANVNAKEATCVTSASTATTKAAEAVAARDIAVSAQIAAEAALDSFDDRYLGSKATAPTLDNDGNALIQGATYWNTTNSTMYVWDGSLSQWIADTFVPTSHTSLSGLAADDHLQYHNDARGDARYSQLAHTHTIDAVPTDNSTNAVQSNGVFDALALKQNTLVSGTNIKTINNISQLGAGNISIPVATKIVEFTSNASVVIDQTASYLIVELWGAGGGAGSGVNGFGSEYTYGGAGGGGGGYIEKRLTPASLTASVSLTIGVEGTGGTTPTTSGSNGVAGTNGGNTSFGAYASAYGGKGGAGAVRNSTSVLSGAGGHSSSTSVNHTNTDSYLLTPEYGGSINAAGVSSSLLGASGGGANGTIGGNSLVGGAGGGSGGGWSNTNVNFNGGAGGIGYLGNAGNGGNIATNGVDGGLTCGGGGGGGFQSTVTGYKGGNGGNGFCRITYVYL